MEKKERYNINKIILLVLFIFIDISKCYAMDDIYDVIIFWGQSNMVGSCSSNLENRYVPSDINSVNIFSNHSRIDVDILQNQGTTRDKVKITQVPGTAYEYIYTTNSLKEISYNQTGEKLFYDPSSKTLRAYKDDDPYYSSAPSKGTNMIPEFARQYYQNTGHKVIAITAAVGGQKLKQFLPSSDAEYVQATTSASQLYIYDALRVNYMALNKYIEDHNIKVGNRLYVSFQGEANTCYKDCNESQNDLMLDNYESIYKKIHNYMKQDFGITAGALVETARINGNLYDGVSKKHEVDEKIIRENSEIILGSSYAWDRFVPRSEDFSKCKTSLCTQGLSYSKALEYALFSADFSDTNNNAIHFTSASLSQIGRDVANNYSKIKKISVSSMPSKTKYYLNANLDLSGLKILVDFPVIKDDVINVTSDMVSGFDKSKLGVQSVSVTYKGQKTNFNVEVVEKVTTNSTMKTTTLPINDIDDNNQNNIIDNPKTSTNIIYVIFCLLLISIFLIITYVLNSDKNEDNKL